jgi:hypothetical protein
MLARSGLGDDALLAQALRQQNLSDCVVDLVRTRVIAIEKMSMRVIWEVESCSQVLTLQPNLGTASNLCQVLGEVQVGRAVHVFEQTVPFSPKLRI